MRQIQLRAILANMTARRPVAGGRLPLARMIALLLARNIAARQVILETLSSLPLEIIGGATNASTSRRRLGPVEENTRPNFLIAIGVEDHDSTPTYSRA
jgi:hypothetical protein